MSRSFLFVPADSERKLQKAGDSDADAIVRIDPRNGSQKVISSGGNLQSPSGIAIDENGAIFDR